MAGAPLTDHPVLFVPVGGSTTFCNTMFRDKVFRDRVFRESDRGRSPAPSLAPRNLALTSG